MDKRLGPSLRRKLLISNILESVLCSVDSSDYIGRTENEKDVEMDEGKNLKKTDQTKIEMRGQRQRRKQERIRNI